MPIWLEAGGLRATRNRPGSLIVLSLAILPSLRDSELFSHLPRTYVPSAALRASSGLMYSARVGAGPLAILYNAVAHRRVLSHKFKELIEVESDVCF